MASVRSSILLVCGWTSLGLGVVGLAVPILPTVPFVLLAAACFVRSSERCHSWLVTHPLFGRHIADYEAGRGIARGAKIVALAAAVTIYIVRLPTADAREPAPEDPTRDA